MYSQVRNTAFGYVVEVRLETQFDFYQWFPIRNFGDCQSYAYDYKNYIVPMLKKLDINLLIRTYKNEPVRHPQRLITSELKRVQSKYYNAL